VFSQVLPPLELIEYGIPPVLGGLVIGYAIGGSSHLSIRERIGLAVVICFLGGFMLSVLMFVFLPVTTQTVLFGIISFAGGYVFGAVYHWSPPERAASRPHVVFEPEDDEEFDREIDKALGGDK
jgi:hypothetical protein